MQEQYNKYEKCEGLKKYKKLQRIAKNKQTIAKKIKMRRIARKNKK